MFTGLFLVIIFKSGHHDLVAAPAAQKILNCPDDRPSWMKLKPEEMSAQELTMYFSWSNSSSCKLANDFGGAMLKNPSGFDGQKAVCLLPASVAPPPGSCIVYSIGINNEWSFDDAMENFGCTIYAFDPSMSDAEDQFDRSSSIHFRKIGLAALDQNETDDQEWKSLTLGSIRRLLGHQDRVIDYLKIDIEFGEWTVLPQIMKSGELVNVRQMAVDIHFRSEWDLNKYREMGSILWSLEREHGMNRFDSKENLWSSGKYQHLGVEGSFSYEMAWFNTTFL